MDSKENGNNFSAIERREIEMRGSGRTVSDAIHPRFTEDSETEMKEFQKKHYYYCEICNGYFAPTTLALREHFNRSRIDHRPISSCVYCKGPVYGYTINQQDRVFHDCMDSK